jgi:ribosomal protein S18 acetylase RimI-like enzyme
VKPRGTCEHLDVMFELRTLSERDLGILHAAMLDAFANYPIPMQPPPAAFELLLHRRGVVWPLSLGAFEDGELIAYTLTARSDVLAYDLMTGVRQAAQGQGVVDRLFEALWPLLRGEGIERMQLEVITINTRAERAYARLGFVRARRLICLKWPNRIVDVGAPKGVAIVEATMLDWSTWMRWWDCDPAWPSAIASAERSEPRALVAQCEGRACGVAIASGSDLLQIAIAPDMRRRGIARALLAELQRWTPGLLRVLNVDERATALLAALTSTGAQRFIEQWEMTRPIKPANAGDPS